MVFDSDKKEYVDFLISIQILTKNKEVIESDVDVWAMYIYDYHARICTFSNQFVMAVIENGWVAFIFQEKVYTHPCSASEILLTETHKQSNLN